MKLPDARPDKEQVTSMPRHLNPDGLSWKGKSDCLKLQAATLTGKH